jgi:signal transduction histidine kinase
VVGDHGKGIAPELLPYIFTPFEQGGRAVTQHFGGLGLGLAITKSLVEAHGGRLTAASDGPGQGATFTVELPLEQAAPGLASRENVLAASGA